MYRVRAKFISLGGGILASLLSVLLIILWVGTHVPARATWLEVLLTAFTGAMILYVIDGASESIQVDDGTLVFNGWLTHRRRVSLQGVVKILLVHEGLNPEWGIETLIFERKDGDHERLSLGPLWRHRDLEALLADLEAMKKNPSLAKEEGK